jgi:hypothetical protein
MRRTRGHGSALSGSTTCATTPSRSSSSQEADILLLARIAGHEDPSITLRVYTHLLNDDVSEAAKQHDPLRRVRARREVDVGPPAPALASRNGSGTANLSAART